MLSSSDCSLYRTSLVKEVGTNKVRQVLLARSTDHGNCSLTASPDQQWKHSTHARVRARRAAPGRLQSLRAPQLWSQRPLLLRGPETEAPGPAGEQGPDPGAGARPAPHWARPLRPAGCPQAPRRLPTGTAPAASRLGPSRHPRSLTAARTPRTRSPLRTHRPLRRAERARTAPSAVCDRRRCRERRGGARGSGCCPAAAKGRRPAGMGRAGPGRAGWRSRWWSRNPREGLSRAFPSGLVPVAPTVPTPCFPKF